MRTKFIYVLSISIIACYFSACRSSTKLNNNTYNETKNEQSYIITELFIEAKKNLLIGNQEHAIKSFNKCLKLDPNHDASYYELARIYEYTNPEKSIELIKQAIEINTKNQWYKEFLIRVYAKQKNYKEAISIYYNLIELEPNRKDYYYKQANLFIKDNNYDKALATYQTIIDKFGYNEDVLKQQKQIHLKQGEYKKAIEILEQLSAKHPLNKEYYGMIAETYSNMGKPEIAITYYLKIIEIDPNDGFVHFALSDYYKSINNSSKAISELYIGMQSKTLDTESKMRVLLKQMKLGNTNADEKIVFDSLLSIALKTNPQSPKILALKADYCIQNNNNKEAIIYFNKILAIDSSKFTIWEQLLLAEKKEGNYESIKKISRRALRIFPQQPNLYYFSALAYKEENNWKKVRDKTKLGNNFVYNKKDKAAFYALQAKAEIQLGEWQMGIINYNRAIKYDPGNAYYKKEFAFTLASHNLEAEKALSLAKEALEVEVNNPDYIYVYTYCLFVSGNIAEAQKWIKQSRKKFPDHKDLQLLEMEMNKD